MNKCSIGMVGNPMFKYGDRVGFYIKPYGKDKEIFCEGSIYIIDRYGTFEQDEEPSYDIMVDDWNNTGEKMLVKHVRESHCYALEEGEE